MKKVPVILILLCALSSCSSNEAPEPPKPRAVIDFDVENTPFSVQYEWWNDRWYVEIYIVVYEKNGVGVHINVIKTTWHEGKNEVGSSTHTGGYVAPNGSSKFYIYSYFSGKYRADKFTIRIEGKDTNGYNVSKEYYWTITWDSARAARFSEVKF